MTIPAFDLTRVAVARLAFGQAPWLGDHRHLGQVLSGAGWSKLSGTAAVGLPMAPSASWAALGWAGVGLAALGYLALAGRGLCVEPA